MHPRPGLPLKHALRRLPMLGIAAACMWGLASCAPLIAEEQPAPEAEPAVPQPEDEAAVRKRFFQSFTRAEKPALKADAVLMLRGVKEKDSLRVLTGLLGDGNPDVRRNACRVMGDIADYDGYLVKALMGALFDRDRSVRRAAVDAIGRSMVKGSAIKALINLLADLSQAAEEDHALAYAAHRSLEKLTGHKFKDAQGVGGLATTWRAWWKEFGGEVEKADEKFLRLPPHLRERVAERAAQAAAQAEAVKQAQARAAAKQAAAETPAQPPVPEPQKPPDEDASPKPAPDNKAEDRF